MVKIRNRGVHKLLATTFAFGLMSLSAHAGGFGIHEQSAEFQGSSFAGVAAGGYGLSSMFWNPATVTRFSGLKSDYNAALIVPYSRAREQLAADGGSAASKGYSGDSGNIGKAAVVPASYTSLQLTDTLWAGLSVNAPFGMKTENDPNSLGALYGYKSEIVTINISPTLGLKLNDMFSIAAGLQINYMEGDLSTASNGALTSRVKGDDWGLGFTLGLHFTPVEGTEIGIGYRSRIKHKLKGSLTRIVTTPAPTYVTLPATVDHTLPDMATFSIRHRLTNEFTLMGTVEWTNWSLLREFRVVTSAGSRAEAYNWNDGWLFSLGGEYAVNDTLTLRAGYAFEKSPVPDSTRGVRVPDNDRHWLSAGLTYMPNDWLKLHAAYTHIFVKDGDVSIPADLSSPGLLASYKQHVNIVSVGATIDTGKLFFGN